MLLKWLLTCIKLQRAKLNLYFLFLISTNFSCRHRSKLSKYCEPMNIFKKHLFIHRLSVESCLNKNRVFLYGCPYIYLGTYLFILFLNLGFGYLDTNL